MARSSQLHAIGGLATQNSVTCFVLRRKGLLLWTPWRRDNDIYILRRIYTYIIILNLIPLLVLFYKSFLN